jgi:hypothetical protein
MLKLNSIILSMIAAATISTPSLAMNTPDLSAKPAIDRPDGNLQAQIIIKVGSPQYRREQQRQRRIERERERREAARRAARRTARRVYNRNY